MPLALTLRTRTEVSPFLRQLLRVVTAPGGNNTFICSGYFADFVLDDDRLRNAIKDGCASGHLVTIGGMFEDPKHPGIKTANYTYYLQFVQRLRNDGVDVHAYEALHPQWHSKIAIRTHNTTPIAAIIGSSNFSRPAILEDHDTWNLESDVTIWVPELDAYFRTPDPDLRPEEYALLQFDPTERLKESDRLRELMQILEDLRRSGKLLKLPQDEA